MIDQCVNPACRTEFRLFNSGDLYAIDLPHRDPEHFWVCSACASKFNVSVDPMGIVSLVPRSELDPASPVHPHVNLRLVAHAARRMPWRRCVPAGLHPAVMDSGNREPGNRDGPTPAAHLQRLAL
jgi:hypothetical protein